MPPPSTATAPSLQDLQREYDKLIKERDALASSVHKLEYEVPEALGSMGWTVFSDFKTESAELVSKANDTIRRAEACIEMAKQKRAAYLKFLDDKFPQGVAHIISEIRRRQRDGQIPVSMANKAVKSLEAASGLRENEM